MYVVSVVLANLAVYDCTIVVLCFVQVYTTCTCTFMFRPALHKLILQYVYVNFYVVTIVEHVGGLYSTSQ